MNFKRHGFNITSSFLVLMVLATSPCVLAAEKVIITIRLLNGRNGKPIRDEDLNVFRDQPHFAENFRADRNGIIKFAIDRDALVSFMSNIQITCHEVTAIEKSAHELQQYKVRAIIEAGISDTNMCSKKVRVEAKPGEFIFYERPRTLWEWMAL